MSGPILHAMRAFILGLTVVLVLGLGAGMGTPAWARDGKIAFSVQLRGVAAGRATLHAQVDGDRYAVTGIFRTTGLVGLFAPIEHRVAARGRLIDGRPVPERYEEERRRRKEHVLSWVDYRNGIPGSKQRQPARKSTKRPVVPLRLRKGTVDPATALWLVLRDQPAATVCRQRLAVFDGHKLSRLVFAGAPRRAGGQILCSGALVRVAGYRPDELARHRSFPFTMEWAKGPAGDWQLQRLESATIEGRAVMERLPSR